MTLIYNLLGIIFIGIIFDILSPNHKINNFLKCIFSFFLVYTLVYSISGYMNNLDFSSLLKDVSVDYGLLDEIGNLKKESYENILETVLENDGFYNVDINVSLVVSEDDFFEIENVTINLTDLVLNDVSLNINKYEVITKRVCEILSIDEDKVMFYDF